MWIMVENSKNFQEFMFKEKQMEFWELYDCSNLPSTKSQSRAEKRGKKLSSNTLVEAKL